MTGLLVHLTPDQWAALPVLVAAALIGLSSPVDRLLHRGEDDR